MTVQACTCRASTRPALRPLARSNGRSSYVQYIAVVSSRRLSMSPRFSGSSCRNVGNSSISWRHGQQTGNGGGREGHHRVSLTTVEEHLRAGGRVRICSVGIDEMDRSRRQDDPNLISYTSTGRRNQFAFHVRGQGYLPHARGVHENRLARHKHSCFRSLGKMERARRSGTRKYRSIVYHYLVCVSNGTRTTD